jgi:hypothetical protein
MSLFDQLVDAALRAMPQCAPLRVVVEKELLRKHRLFSFHWPIA